MVMRASGLILREIKTSKARFFAIAAIFALGVGFYSGLASTMPDMKKSMDRYADDYSLYDIRLLSEYGFTEDDTAVISDIPDIERVTPAYGVDALIDTSAARIMSVTDGVNGMRLLSGRMPEKDGECVIGRNKMSGYIGDVGDSISLSADNDADTLDMFKRSEFTVVGIVESPVYPSVQRGTASVGQGQLHHFLYILPSDFDTDIYTEMFITVRGAREQTLYSDAYDKTVGAVSDALENDTTISGAQLLRVKNDAQSELDEKTAEYNDKKAQAENELNDAKSKLDNAYADIQAAEKELASGEETLADRRMQYEAGYRQISALYGEAAADIQLADARAQLDAAQTEISRAREQLEDGRAEYRSGMSEYNTNKDKAEKELDDAKKKIDDAQADIDGLKAPEMYVLTLDENYGIASFKQDAERINNIARVFPIIFFVVAALVCLTTMTRMVDEQRTKIGTLCALGYGKAYICMQYLSYSGVASLVGGIVGIALGVTVIPIVIFNTYSMLYSVPTLVFTINIPKTVLAFLIAFICTGVATIWATYGSLKSRPSELMRPRAPKPGKKVILERIGFIWRNISFTSKVTARNILRYKKRFFMTVIGIAGCSALLLTGFGLKDSISDMVPLQYGKLQNFDLTVYLAKDTDSVRECINAQSSDRLYTYKVSSDARSDSGNLECFLFVPENAETFSQYINLRERKSRTAVEFPEDGYAVIAEKLSTRLGIGIGDRIEVKKSDSEYVSFEISGITENYIYNYVYVSPETYTQAFEKSPAYNEALIKTADAYGAADVIMKNEDVSSLTLTDDMLTNFGDIFDSLNGVVLLLIISACLLNFIVLYNLTNINIGERVREIATVKVLGFFPLETDAYIYRENVVLTLIGTAFGLGLGRILHGFVITTAEIDMIMFSRSISVSSYVWAAVLTFVFSALVNIFMHFRLKGISMTESLKSTE